jgi:hypothetical protein
MPLLPGCLIVEVAVMAFRKKVDAVDIGTQHCLSKLLRIKVTSDIADGRTGVKIKVDLTKKRWPRHSKNSSHAAAGLILVAIQMECGICARLA